SAISNFERAFVPTPIALKQPLPAPRTKRNITHFTMDACSHLRAILKWAMYPNNSHGRLSGDAGFRFGISFFLQLKRKGVFVKRSLKISGWNFHPAVANAGNLVRIEDGCATVTGYKLPRATGSFPGREGGRKD